MEAGALRHGKKTMEQCPSSMQFPFLMIYFKTKALTADFSIAGC